MLATAGLVLALRIAACPASHPHPLSDMQNSAEFRVCCTTSTVEGTSPLEQECYRADNSKDVCKVADAAHRCCVTQQIEENWLTACVNFNETSCERAKAAYSSIDQHHVKWCPAELSAGAIAGIAVGAVLGPFALGLAYKSLMYK